MHIVSIKTINGPNVYHNRPVLIMKINLGEWVEVASTDVPNFYEKITSLLPGLKAHTCSIGTEGGFLERLRRGTYMAHIIEHIAIELSVLSEIGVHYGKTRYAGETGLYDIITRFVNESGMKACLRQGTEILKSILADQPFDVNQAVAHIRQQSKVDQLGPSSKALLDAAIKRNIPARRVAGNSLIQFGYGKKIRRVQTAVTENTSLIATDIAQDKELTKNILRDQFISVPDGVVVGSIEELKEAAKSIAPPYAVKPFNGNHGNGVCLNLQTTEDLEEAYRIASRFSDYVILEEMCTGRDYRILVVNGKMVAAAERIPPFVVGDGKQTVQQLIDQLNLDPRRAPGHDGLMTRIEVDDILLAELSKQNLSLDSVVAVDEKIILRKNANLSSGGSAIDVTDIVHPEVKDMCERAARAIGLDICGIDLIHENIELPVGNYAKVIEVNAGPGLRMHIAPSAGMPRPVGEHILDMIYPSGDNGRIPIVSVTGTNGKTTVTRMLHKILSYKKDLCVGMTTTDGIWIGQQKITAGDTTGPKSGQAVLSDTSVDVAVLEVARGGLLRGGLSYDWSDVSIVTNIREDHIGQDGIESVEDLVWIKSLVAERVRENGTIVLNADDVESYNLKNSPKIKKIKRNIFLFSMTANNPALEEHLNEQQSACWLDSGYIYVQHKNLKGRLFEMSAIPATMNGLADFQLANVLASVAAALAMDVPVIQIFQGLQSFNPSSENRGRMNIYKVKDGYVILDYGHNQDAIISMGKMLAHFPGYTKSSVFGLPGDRSQDLILKTVTSAANVFDKFILRDDDDLRGRKAGEMPALMCEAIRKLKPECECTTILSESSAVDFALENIRPKEIVTIFYDDFENVWKSLSKWDPIPVNEMPLQKAKIKLNESAMRVREPAEAKDAISV